MKKKFLVFALALCVSLTMGLSSYAEDTNKDAMKSEVKYNQEMPIKKKNFHHKKHGKSMCAKSFDKECIKENEGICEKHNKFHKAKHSPFYGEDMELKKAEFEHRLQLTDEQKKQIELKKKQDIENIKPIMKNMREKMSQFKDINEDKTLTPDEKMKKKQQLRGEIKTLKMQADNCRKENMKNFESILTDKQKKEFQKIKTEQRKEMEKRRAEHKKMMEKKHKEMEKKFEENQKKRAKYGLPVQPKPKCTCDK